MKIGYGKIIDHYSDIRNMSTVQHELKTWKEYYQAIILGNKAFEIRKNDRNFCAGDQLILKEYDHDYSVYTGREMLVNVSYVLHGGCFGIMEGYCIMSIRIVRVLVNTNEYDSYLRKYGT